MGLDNELRVEITAGTAGLQGGLAEAQDEVAASSGQMAAAQATLAAANARLAETEKALIAAGANLADANTAASLSLQGLREEAAQAAAALASMVPAETAAAAATVEATAGYEALAAAQEVDTKATYNRMEAMGVARVSMGAMDGSMGMMAGGLARLAAGSSVLGPLLNNMLPLALFAVGAEMIYDLGKAIYTAFDMGGEAAEKFRDDLAETNLGWRATADATQVEIDKLDAANAKLEHVPNPNAQYEAMHRAAMEADKLDEKLTQLLGKEEKLTEELATPKLAQVLTLGMGGTGVKYEDTLLKEHIRHLDEATTAQQINDEELRHAASLQTRLKELQQWQTTGGGPGIEIDYSNEIAATQHLIDIQQKEMNQLSLMNQQTAAQNKPDTVTADPKAKAAKEDPAVRDYFEARKRDLEDYTRRVEEDTREQEEMMTRGLDAEVKGNDAANKMMDESDKHRTEAFKADRDAKISAAEEVSKREIAAANWQYEETKRQIEQQEALGHISHKVAEQRLIEASLLRDSTISASQKNVLSLYDPIEGGKQLAGYQHAEDTMKADARKGAAEREAIRKKEQDDFVKSWKAVTNEFNQDFTQAFNSWMTHSETAGKAFGSMLGELERQTIDFVAKYLLQKAELWAMDETMQLLGIAKEKAATDTAATQQIASNNTVIASNQALQTSTTAIVSAETALAVATTSAASAFAAGIIGNTAQIASNVTLAESDQGLAAAEAALAAAPEGVLAAIAAGSKMYAAFIPWTTAAGFSIGGVVPGSIGAPFPAIVHAGERVLTASQNSTYESLANSSSSRASSFHLNYAPTIHGNADAGMLQEHSRQILGQVSRMIRPEARV